MQQELSLKNKILGKALSIYTREDVDNLLASQIVLFLPQFEKMLFSEDLSKVTRLKLYELLNTLILIDNTHINDALSQKTFIS